MLTEYKSVIELELMFEQYMVPYETKEIGTSESGVTINSIVDEKAQRTYIERYDPLLDVIKVHAFNNHELPKTWVLEDGGKSHAIS